MLFKRSLSEKNPAASSPKKGKKSQRPKTLFEHQQAARAAYGALPGVGGRDRRGRQRHLKRVFSGKEREQAASSGAAMPDGSYPIQNEDDLRNAIQAIGRAKKPGKTKAHIATRARALGRSDLIPGNWSGKTMKNKGKFPGAAPPFGRKAKKDLVKIARDLGVVRQLTKDAVSFNETLAEMSSTDYAEGVIEAIRDACHAIKETIESISECDDLAPDERATAISESFDQFMTHLSGIAPDAVTKTFKKGVGSMSKLTKALKKAYTSVPAHDAKPPAKAKDVVIDNDADEDLTEGTGIKEPKTATTKQLRKAVAKLEKRLAKADSRLAAALTMSKAAKDHMDDPDADMDEDKKKAFLDLTPEERTKFIENNPLAVTAQKRVAALPEPIRKQLEQSAKDSVELAKRVEADELREFSKQATDVGQPAALGASLRTLAKGLGTEEDRTKAIDEVMKALTAAAEQARTAGIFKEFGTGRGATGGAWDQLLAKAEELRSEVSKGAGAPLTPEQAFAKVYENPANVALVKQYNEEKRRAA